LRARVAEHGLRTYRRRVHLDVAHARPRRGRFGGRRGEHRRLRTLRRARDGRYGPRSRQQTPRLVGAGAQRGRPLERGHRGLLWGRGSGTRRATGCPAPDAAGRAQDSEAPVNGKVFAQNRKALHDFAIEETYEAGIVLTGPEVKSVRQGRANLKESYARVRNGEVFLIGAHISPYANARQERQLPTRDRKLLLHRKEIDRLIGKSQEEGK